MADWNPLSLIGDAIGGIASIFGASSTNDANRDIAAMNNTFNAEQAHLARDYATGARATQHQAQVADLRKAGLNPLLSSNTGAGTPSPGAASSSGNPHMENPLAGMGNLGAALRDAIELENRTKTTQADVRVKDANAAATISNSKLDPTRKALMLQQIEESRYRSHPNTTDALIARYAERLLRHLETNVSRRPGPAQQMRKATQDFIKGMSPEDWSKIQNVMEGKLKGRR